MVYGCYDVYVYGIHIYLTPFRNIMLATHHIPHTIHHIICIVPYHTPYTIYHIPYRSVGTRVLYGYTSELGNILLDAITFDPPQELLDSVMYYTQVYYGVWCVRFLFLTLTILTRPMPLHRSPEQY
ncbi:hypothetical protein EON63_17275 [archaeon]|nr:MAG: hypothetical protein EON63_17275 [archaeon]